MKDLNIPESEKARFEQMVRAQPELLSSRALLAALKPLAKQVISDPQSPDIGRLIQTALRQEQAYSVIRLGDGEMNLLAYSKYPEVPEVSFKTAVETVNKRQHSFKTSRTWLYLLEEMMHTAMLESDLIGVLGLWRPGPLSMEQFIDSIDMNFRGRWGQWIGLDYIKKLALKGVFQERVLAPAHLYFAVIEQLDQLLACAAKTYLITDQSPVHDLLSKQHPDGHFALIQTPISPRPLVNTEPDFLYNVMSQLPPCMKGTLTLVGAGPWSEFYCGWIKRRGGVAVDIGTGFDLLLGHQVRPVHRKVKLNL
ncbi:hypothetical protein [Marinicella meishanensis]|uniref:hypothetical protein n=1 Tax=Marinicella meishanensis TaxID=2873263 RepID=UPI001CBBA4EA|nr:hypothetical protein [Marinicella sp. NBU2979]